MIDLFDLTCFGQEDVSLLSRLKPKYFMVSRDGISILFTMFKQKPLFQSFFKIKI